MKERQAIMNSGEKAWLRKIIYWSAAAGWLIWTIGCGWLIWLFIIGMLGIIDGVSRLVFRLLRKESNLSRGVALILGRQRLKTILVDLLKIARTGMVVRL